MRIQSGGGLRNYSYDGREIQSITLYGNSQVYARIGGGWLEDQDFKQDGQPDKFSNDAGWIDIDEPSVARKENLTRTDNYVIPTRKGTVLSSEKSHYDLYIHVAPPKDLGEFLMYQTDSETNYSSFLEFAITVGVRVATGLDGMERVIWSMQERSHIKIRTGSRSEITRFGERVDALEEELKSLNISINTYNLKELLKHYDLVRKE